MENTTEQTADTCEALEIPVIKKAHTSTTSPTLVVQSLFEDQLGNKLPSSDREPSMEIDEVSCFWFGGCRRPLYFRDKTTDIKYVQVAFLACISRSTKPLTKCFFVKRVRTGSTQYDVDVRDNTCCECVLHHGNYKGRMEKSDGALRWITDAVVFRHASY